MSNTNPFIGCVAAAACTVLLSACSLLPGYQDSDRPYRAEAKEVVSAVAIHTPLDRRCWRIGTVIVEAGISARMAKTEAEVRHSALVSALAGVEWDNSGCPSSAVPGLSFGTNDIAKQIAKRAHRMARLL